MTFAKISDIIPPLEIKECTEMDIEKVQELVSQSKSLLIMLANDLQTTNQDDTAYHVVRATQNIIAEIEKELKEK